MIREQCYRPEKHPEHRWREKLYGVPGTGVVLVRDCWCEGRAISKWEESDV